MIFKSAVAFTAGAILCLSLSSARSEDDPMSLPITFKSLPTSYQRQLVRNSIRDKLVSVGCLPGASDKRAVCTWKLGDYMSIMASTSKGGSDVVGVTMICATANLTQAVNCLMADVSMMEVVAPDTPKDARGKILNTLVDGLGLGNEISITTDDRKFTLQKSMGLWFHIYASGADE